RPERGADLLLFPTRRSSDLLTASLAAPAASHDAPEWLAQHVVRAPWFAGKHRLLGRVRVRAATTCEIPGAALLVVRAEFLQGDPEDYGIWLTFLPEGDFGEFPSASLAARATVGGVAGRLGEAQHVSEFRARLLARLQQMLSEAA